MQYTPDQLKKIIKEAVREELLFGHYQVKKVGKKHAVSESAKDIYIVREAAQFLHMSVPTLRKKYANKIIQRVQEGRRVIFRKAHLEQYLEKYTIR